MNHLKDYLKEMENLPMLDKPIITGEVTPRSQREEINNKFFDTIDKEREGTKYPPINRRLYAIKLNTAFKSLWDLQRFYAECADYPKGFGIRFFGGFKVQKWQ